MPGQAAGTHHAAQQLPERLARRVECPAHHDPPARARSLFQDRGRHRQRCELDRAAVGTIPRRDDWAVRTSAQAGGMGLVKRTWRLRTRAAAAGTRGRRPFAVADSVRHAIRFLKTGPQRRRPGAGTPTPPPTITESVAPYVSKSTRSRW